MIAKIIGFFKTPAGGAILFLIAMFTFFYFVRNYREHKAMEAEAKEGVNVLGQKEKQVVRSCCIAEQAFIGKQSKRYW